MTVQGSAEVRCCKRCRHYDPAHRPAACCHALGRPVPWTQMIETDCKGEGAPLWQPIKGGNERK